MVAAWAVIVLAVVAIYGQTLSFGYVNYDDKVIQNLARLDYDVFSLEGLKKTFLPAGLATYQPLRQIAGAFVYRFSGTAPFGYHLFNLVLYLLNLVAVFFLLHGLLRAYCPERSPGSASWALAGTALFAVHPVHVEAVAWMNSNKELVAGLFFFLSLASYLKSRSGPVLSVPYFASWLFLVLGLLAKPSVAALPLVVLALELTLADRAAPAKVLLRVAPFAAVVGVIAFFFIFQTTTAAGSFLQGSAGAHALSMAAVLAKYVISLLVPVNLCHSYPPPYFSGDYDWRLLAYLGLDLALAAVLVVFWRRRQRGLAFAVLFFLLNLLPVSGIVPIRIFRADRYLYLSSFGFVMAGVILLWSIYTRISVSRVQARLYSIATVALLLLLAILAFDRCRAWKDGLTLWRSAVLTHSNYQYNHFGFGSSLYAAGRYDQALEAFRNANRFRENFSCDYWIAKCCDQLGDSLQADRYYRRVVDLFSGEMTNQLDVMVDVYGRLGLRDELAASLFGLAGQVRGDRAAVRAEVVRLEQRGYHDLAVQFAEAAGIEFPSSVGAFTRLAERHLAAGRLDSATLALRLASEKKEEPLALAAVEGDLSFAERDWAKAAEHYERSGDRLTPARREKLAAALLDSGQPERALQVFRSLAQDSIRARPSRLNNIGVALEAMDSLSQAEALYRQAVSLQENYVDAWFNLGNVLTKQGRYEEALDCYGWVVKYEGPSVELARRRAGLLTAAGRRPEALAAWREAVSLSANDPAVLLEAADAAWEAGSRESARRYYENLLKIAGDRPLPLYVSQRIKKN
ncbi:MAG: tetratricopeptide repeat protein [Candidatus Glassbacteria bacterium]